MHSDLKWCIKKEEYTKGGGGVPLNGKLRKIMYILPVLLLLSALVIPALPTPMDTVTIPADRSYRHTEPDPNALFQMTQGHHTRWIDRIHKLPHYAADFYNWLCDNIGRSLSDPSLGTMADEAGFYHEIITEAGNYRFRYESDDHTVETAGRLIDQARQTAYRYTRLTYDAFKLDHPEIFWLEDVTVLESPALNVHVQHTDSTVYLTWEYQIRFYLVNRNYDIRMEAYRESGALPGAKAVFDAARADILSRCPNTNHYDRIRYLNRELTRRNGFNTLFILGKEDTAPADSRTAFSAIVGRSGVSGPLCTGYAQGFKVLCDAVDIPCILVIGYAQSEPEAQRQFHMWNYVQLDDQWYAVDVSWNDPYVSTDAGAVSGWETEKWLLLGSRSPVAEDFTFLQSHEVTNTMRGQDWLNGPQLSTDPCTPMGIMEINGEDAAYYVDGELSDITGLVEYGGQLYYLRQGRWDTSFTGFADKNDRSYWVEQGLVRKEERLQWDADTLYYLKDGYIDRTCSGILTLDQSYYVREGRIMTQYTGFYREGSALYYIVRGKLATDVNAPVMYGGRMYCVAAGVVPLNFRGSFFLVNRYVYVEKGICLYCTNIP